MQILVVDPFWVVLGTLEYFAINNDDCLSIQRFFNIYICMAVYM